MATETIDANTAAESSTAAAQTSDRRPDAMEDSSSSQNTDSNADASKLTLNDFVRKNVDAFKPEAEGDVVDPSEKSGSENEQDKGEAQADQSAEGEKETGEEKAEGEEDSQGEDSSKKDEDDKGESENRGPVPYERFQEVIAKRQELEQAVEASKPMVENYRHIDTFCRSNGITPEQFSAALEVQALLNTNPAEALKKLTPIMESLQGFVGDKLPADLQAKVDSGKLELDDAKEMASLRAQREFGTKKTQFDQQSMQRQQHEQLRQQMAASVNTWEASKRKLDPDYAPKANENVADGKWEVVRDKYLAMLNMSDERGNPMHPIRSANDVVALMDKAYAAVNATFSSRFSSKRPTPKRLPTNGSSQTSGNNKTIEGAETMQEAIRIGLSARSR